MIGIISALARGVFGIEPQAAQGYLPFVASIMKGELIDQANFPGDNDLGIIRPYIVDDEGAMLQDHYNGKRPAENAGHLVVPIHDVIMKTDYCYAYGTYTYHMILRAAEKDNNIKSVILSIDSPGGMVAGTATLSDQIKNFEKPVVAFVDDGLMASAAYYIGAHADEIIASQPTSEIGSIGVYTTIVDYSEYYKQLGINVLEVYAKQSTEKNKEYYEAINGNLEPMRDRVSHLAGEFIKAVKAGRGEKINDDGRVFKGAIYNAKDAKKVGLIDRIGDFNTALTSAQKLIKKQANTIKLKS